MQLKQKKAAGREGERQDTESRRALVSTSHDTKNKINAQVVAHNRETPLTVVTDAEQPVIDGINDTSWHTVNPNTGRAKLIKGTLAEILAMSYEAIYTTGRFYLYRNGVYEISDNGQIETLIMNYIREEARTKAAIQDVAYLWSLNNSVKVNPEVLNSNPYIVNVRNGLYDVIQGKLTAHSPSCMSTVQLNCNYDEKAKGDRFLQFINEVVPNEQLQKLVQEILGYSLTSFNNAKKAFILTGKSDTGKSTFLNIIQDLLGSQNISNIPFQRIGDRFNIAELYGKTANIFSDLPNTPIAGDGVFKALTGDDSVQGERKFGNPFSFYNKAKLIFSCNQLPDNYGDKTDAFYKRLIILPFDNSIPEKQQDAHLRDKLKKEVDFIFTWAMEGLQRLISNNFKFTEVLEVAQLVSNYKTVSNSVMLFVRDACVREAGAQVRSTEIYGNYKNYCEKNGYRPVKNEKFNSEILSNYPDIDKPENERIGNQRTFTGIKIKY